VVLFQAGQLCCKSAAASCCWLHQSILVRTEVSVRGPAGTAVEQKILISNPNLVMAAHGVGAMKQLQLFSDRNAVNIFEKLSDSEDTNVFLNCFVDNYCPSLFLNYVANYFTLRVKTAQSSMPSAASRGNTV